ncbi:MFS transporter [Actinoplanes sp. NPDC051859]|uniref:MFS transporter n=1 Tax=Actinoplanes sp. NPDC051859 TaxID=3363909 RepID=UPI0037B78F03
MAGPARPPADVISDRAAPPTRRPATRLFAVLATGHGISLAGNYLSLIAVNLYAYATTGSATTTGLLMAARLGSGFLAGPVAGRLVARADRRTVMIWCDVAQAAAVAALALVGGVPLLWVVAVVTGAGHTVFTVALRTSIPDLVGAEDRVRGNGYLVTAKAFGSVVGFASAGPLIDLFGYRPAFAVNVASFLVSAAVLSWLPLHFGRPAVRSDNDGAAAAGGRGVPAMLSAVWLTVPAIVVVRGLEGWGSAAHNVALPVAGDPSLVSRFWTAWAIGSLFAYQLVRRRGRQPGERTYAVLAVVASLAFIAAFAGGPSALTIVAALVAGLADGVAELAYVTTLQARDDRARIFGVSAAAETLGLSAGMLGSALLLDLLPALPVVALFHGVTIAAALMLLGRRRTAKDRAAAATATRSSLAPEKGT